MIYYSFFNLDKELLGCDNNKMIKDGSGMEAINTEIPEELFLDYKANPSKYIAGEKEIEVEVPDEVEEGEEQTYHTETITVPYPVINPNWEEEELEKAKQAKYQEANLKAFEYLESGEAVFTYAEGKSIEATDGNIAKLGLALVNFILQQDYTSTIEWNTKENENVQLNVEQLQIIVAGLQGIQSVVWTVKFPAYNTAISEAETIEEVNAIVIDYGEE